MWNFRVKKSISVVMVCIGIVGACIVYSASRSADPLRVAPAFKEKTSPVISGMIVPHHNLVKDQRAQTFAHVRERFFQEYQPETIILVSPNHYSAGRADIQVTAQEWSTAQGDIHPATAIITELVAAGAAREETSSFSGEHGIRTILADIARSFPGAAIVPLILKMDTSRDRIEHLGKTLQSTCAQCLMIASVDFSHYQPALLADLHDETTLRLLETMNTDEILKKAEVDSPPTLALLFQWARARGTEAFVLDNRTNSGVLAANPDLESTTHLYGWYERGSKKIPSPQVTFFIGGDMMYGRSIAHVYKHDYTQLLKDLGERVFWGVDAALANLEGPISPVPVPEERVGDVPVFHFPPRTIEALGYLRLTGVSLANNHLHDAGVAGLKQTRTLLKNAGIIPMGDPARVGEDTVAFFQGETLRLAVIGVHVLKSSNGTEGVIRALTRDPHTKVLVFPHWGNEYQSRHSRAQEDLAHAWIDAGADLIIGAHPHVIQDAQVYKGRPIIYSVGNFIFDQTFSRETQEGLFVGGSFTDTELRLFFLPHESRALRPALVRGTRKQEILDELIAPLRSYLHHTSSGALLVFPLSK